MIKALNYLVLLVIFFSSSVRAELDILFVNPSIPNEPFWQSVEEITQSAALQLGTKLDVIYGGGNRIVQLAALKSYLAKNKKPNYAIVLNYPGGSHALMSLLEEEQIKFVTLEQTIFGEERDKIGLAGDKYKYWLGEIYFDNHDAGKQLAQSLALLKQDLLPNKETQVVAINGHYGSESEARFNGMREYYESNQGIVYQAVHAGWSEEVAFKQTKALLARFPEINIIWAASDLMALGASEAAVESGRTPNRDIFIGGFDWIPRALKAVEKQSISASIGGHKIMGAWAVISLLLYDNGQDIFAKQSNKKLTFNLDVVTKNNVAHFQKQKAKINWAKYDFKGLKEKVAIRHSIAGLSPLNPNELN
ncbi:ABC transporter substrate-binding protein [Pseudoalteromonas sp. SSM20]|uniref:ABC transporter substrate-binding protein n=1 Tax=Pseudoalteromonas sp. SSM20 TaxID=3139394 RepID=UPI003BA9A246